MFNKIKNIKKRKKWKKKYKRKKKGEFWRTAKAQCRDRAL